MPNFKVELYGDVGFTADGSNILDFLTREARDAYFDSLPHTTRTGTSVNKDFLDTGSIKLEVSDTDTVKYVNASYMRVTSERFVQSTAEPSQEVTYLFIASYEVVSSNENTTVIRYTVVNDNWMNYQFDIKLRPCSVERMHVDRWSADSDKPTVKMPCLDLLEGYYNAIRKRPITNQGVADENDIGLVCVVYTLGYNERKANPYRILVAPIYNQKTEAVKCYAGEFISISDIIDGTLANDLEIAPSAVISVYVQPLPSYDIVMRLGTNYYSVNFGVGDSVPKQIGTKYAYDFPLSGAKYTQTSTGDFAFSFGDKPTDGSVKSTIFEPAMYRNPVCQYKLRYGNVQYILPQNLLDDLNAQSDMLKKIGVSMPINMDGSGQYLYFGDSLEEAIAKGWAFEVPALDGNIINDQWLEYLYTSRGADRAMMWTNIATLGLADLGSTYVSGSIGYRSNMTQAKARQFEYQTQENMLYHLASTRPNSIQAYNSKLLMTELDRKAELATGMATASMRAAAMSGIASAGANAIASYSAQENKESAIKNQPAQVSSIGNIMTLMQSKQLGCELITTEVVDPVKSRYFELFSKFGYYVGAVTQPNLRTRKFFNYLKTNGAIVTGNAPQTVLLNIASMFDAGTTIWHMDKCTKDTLYDYTYENIERSLI